MTMPAARELGQHGIRVNCIAPGVIATPMMMAMPEGVQAQLSEAVVYPPRLGMPSEYAELVISLIENTYINAATIRLDGGLRMS